MRVLHVGNVAQNGYNNAKFLRRLGVDADVVCDEIDALSQPEWEDADLPEGTDALAPWSDVASSSSFRRPEWVIAPAPSKLSFRGAGRIACAASFARHGARLAALYPSLRRDFEELRGRAEGVLTRSDVAQAVLSGCRYPFSLTDLRNLFGRYQIVQAYATHPVLALLARPEARLVAFEHGTLRELPFEDSWRGRLLSIAYRRAAKVIITNADVISSARRLGLENTVFIPHPVDETKYTPGDSRIGSSLRREGLGPVFVAPARQDWREKRNDLIVRGFASIVRSGDLPRALLVLGRWGSDLPRTQALVDELRIGASVRWLPPLPKRELIDLFRGADAVLDQFAFGTFGVTVPEAMACGCPVVMAFDRSLHEWCFSELPPIVDARDERSIAEALRQLAHDPAKRRGLARDGRSWVERHHGWRLVAERQLAIYDEVMRAGA